MNGKSTLGALALALALAATGAAHEHTALVQGRDPGPTHEALVSMYTVASSSTRTASGETLTDGSMNVAHRTLPFGTRLTFYYGGRSACARVNDRGPYSGAREFDLGPGTATALGFPVTVATVGYRAGCAIPTIRTKVTHCHGITLASGRNVRRCGNSWVRGQWNYLQPKEAK